ncbi:hypothetical protein D3C77_563560 [compost metagenome]
MQSADGLNLPCPVRAVFRHQGIPVPRLQQAVQSSEHPAISIHTGDATLLYRPAQCRQVVAIFAAGLIELLPGLLACVVDRLRCEGRNDRRQYAAIDHVLPLNPRCS